MNTTDKPHMYTIDKTVPPPVRGGSVSKYPWRLMAVGDSFFISTAPKAFNCTYANRKFAPKRFTHRAVDGGIRVWRIA